MNKKQMTMLAVGVIAVVAIYWFFFRKKDSKKESNFNPDYLVIGDEMSYIKPCPQGTTKKCCCTKRWITGEGTANETMHVIKYNCCMANEESGFNFNASGKRKTNVPIRLMPKSSSTARNPERCVDANLKVIPCPRNEDIDEADIVESYTIK